MGNPAHAPGQKFRADPPRPSHSSQVGASPSPLSHLTNSAKSPNCQLHAQTADQYRPSHCCPSTVLETRCCRFFTFVSPVQPDGQYESDRQENEVYQGTIDLCPVVICDMARRARNTDGGRLSVPTRVLSTATVSLPLLADCDAPGCRARVNK